MGGLVTAATLFIPIRLTLNTTPQQMEMLTDNLSTFEKVASPRRFIRTSSNSIIPSD